MIMKLSQWLWDEEQQLKHAHSWRSHYDWDEEQQLKHAHKWSSQNDRWGTTIKDLTMTVRWGTTIKAYS
jgi:hypothetical protein